MKKLFMICAVVSVFAACKSKNVDTTDVTGLDTTLMYKNNVYSDTAAIQNGTVAPGGARSQISYPARRSSTGNDPVATQSTNIGTQPQTTQKEGWSNSAKGAVIGGVGGAVAGAVISKKKGQGAIIGGAVGAAGGYIIGRAKDKKEGRIQ
jgi:hypothetical protein